MKLEMNGTRQKQIRSITLWGALANVFLIIIKLAIGAAIKSSALIADGVHSVSDLATDFVVLIGTKLSHRPPDETHPYGHSKLETIACQIIGLVLLVAGLGFVWSAASSVFKGKTNYPGVLVLIVAAICVIIKEILFFLTRKVSRTTHSPVLYANAWHHRSDSFSSLAVLVGGAASLLGWGHADHAATIVVGFMITAVAGKILYEGLIELSEHSADQESIQVIRNVLSETEDVLQWHELRTRKLGAELFVDVHILVEPEMSVLESHNISMKIEEEIKKKLSRPVNTLIHVEPYGEEVDRGES